MKRKKLDIAKKKYGIKSEISFIAGCYHQKLRYRYKDIVIMFLICFCVFGGYLFNKEHIELKLYHEKDAVIDSILLKFQEFDVEHRLFKIIENKNIEFYKEQQNTPLELFVDETPLGGS